MNSKTVIPSEILSTIKSYISSLENNGINVDRAILFGSYARGKQTQESDIDLCIISSSFGKDYRDEMKQLLSLTFPYTYPIDVIPYNPEDLENKYDSIAKEIKEQGILID